MKVLVFEDNLMWSSRLMQSLRGLGHEPVLITSLPFDPQGADVAILNLSSAKLMSPELVADLKANGIRVIGHAGHKESQLIAYGKDAGCDTLATNSELTYKIESLLAGGQA
jgi:hypothetical protein